MNNRYNPLPFPSSCKTRTYSEMAKWQTLREKFFAISVDDVVSEMAKWQPLREKFFAISVDDVVSEMAKWQPLREKFFAISVDDVVAALGKRLMRQHTQSPKTPCRFVSDCSTMTYPENDKNFSLKRKKLSFWRFAITRRCNGRSGYGCIERYRGVR